MFTHQLWGCGYPRWAYAGPSLVRQSCSQRYESRRSDRASAHGPLFGVRRPLRYMTYHLDLDEDQVRTLADILSRLKTERSQAAVDWQRSLTDLADSMDAEEFDGAAVEAALRIRVESEKRMRKEVLEALRKTHAMLDAEQRSTLAYLLRSRQLTI